jgi:hypothetical protein
MRRRMRMRRREGERGRGRSRKRQREGKVRRGEGVAHEELAPEDADDGAAWVPDCGEVDAAGRGRRGPEPDEVRAHRGLEEGQAEADHE